jgi:hypothetical protein
MDEEWQGDPNSKVKIRSYKISFLCKFNHTSPLQLFADWPWAALVSPETLVGRFNISSTIYSEKCCLLFSY